MPEAIPACRRSTEPMTAAVSGATVKPIPNPRASTPGKNVAQYEPPVPGSANKPNPTVDRAGPTISGVRTPMRTASAPAQRLIVETRSTNGRSAAPAAAGE
jgi:hypothetical protein